MKLTPDAEAVIEAAVAWWEGHRPKGWTVAQHRRNPTVNCPTSRAAELAEAVALLAAASPSETDPDRIETWEEET